MTGEYFMGYVPGNLLVQDRHFVRHQHAYNRFPAATSRAAYMMQLYVFTAGSANIPFKFLPHFRGARRVFTGGRTHLDNNLGRQAERVAGGLGGFT